MKSTLKIFEPKLLKVAGPKHGSRNIYSHYCVTSCGSCLIQTRM